MFRDQLRTSEEVQVFEKIMSVEFKAQVLVEPSKKITLRFELYWHQRTLNFKTLNGMNRAHRTFTSY